jgi:hypothetical protein
MVEMFKKIRIIKPEIKGYVISKFMHQVSFLSHINFYQTRRIEREDVCDYGEIGVQMVKIQE